MKNYFTHNNKTLCYGCRCCEHICPTNAIIMVEDEEGFLFPKILKDKCINCKLCERSCPVSSNKIGVATEKFPMVYAAKNKEIATLKKSSSGGMFSALAENILNDGGSIVGCIFDEEFNVIHVVANKENCETLKRMRGSKYVQSDTRDTYPRAKELLIMGKRVLYTGTPCQIAGLKAFLNKDYSNLITVDLICHGTPSNKFFHKYMNALEHKLQGKIFDYKFRDKSKYGWASVGSYQYVRKGKVYKKQLLPEMDYYYYYYYLRGDIYRESCYSCKYANRNRVGDITIADYWNIHKFHEEFYPPDGVSMVMINTAKGEAIFSKLDEAIISVDSKLEYAEKANGNLCNPSERPITRDIVYREIENLGFDEAAKKYCKLKKIVPKIKRAIPYELKRDIRILLKKLR